MIACCRLKLDDETVRVAVGLHLGLDLCVPHLCRCGSPVDARGLHSLVCKQAPGIVQAPHTERSRSWSFRSCRGPSCNRAVSWLVMQRRQETRWSLADSFWRLQVLDVGRDSCLFHGWLRQWSWRAGPSCVAEMAASGVEVKYVLQPIAVKTLGPINYKWVGLRIRSRAGRTKSASLDSSAFQSAFSA